MNKIDCGQLDLDQIQAVARLSAGKAYELMEACVWSLNFCKHSIGVELGVVTNQSFRQSCNVVWPSEKIDEEAVNRSYNRDDAAEDGAEAIALLLAVKRTEYNAVERSMTKTGIDYWLGYKDQDPNNPFQRAGRLEISGIMEESPTNKVSTRVKIKLNQTKPTDHTFPVYVIIVEFGKPYATMVLKNGNC